MDRLIGLGKAINLQGYANRPIEFCQEILEIAPTEEQKAILTNLRDKPVTNVPAAHGVGKSTIAAIAVLWWVFAVEGLAISTAPTEDQVKQILWSEIRKLFDRHKSKLGGTRGELFLRNSEKARAYGFTARNYDTNSFQGKHAERLLLIQDEADGITETIDDGFRSCLTGSRNRGLRIGNPTDKSSAFSKSQQQNPDSVLRIPAWGHPNVSWAYIEQEASINGQVQRIHRLKPEIAAQILDKAGRVLPQEYWPTEFPRDKIPGAISIQWIEDARRDKGEGSVFWQSRVEALYPGDDVEGIIPRSWIDRARHRYDEAEEYWNDLARQHAWRIGVDVADGGGDMHAIAVWRGPVLFSVEQLTCIGDEQDVFRLAEHVAKRVRLLGGTAAIAVDRTGVGSGTLAPLKASGFDAKGCTFGESAKNSKEYRNRKTELYWQLRDALRLGTVAIAPLGELEKQAFEDLAASRYTVLTGGQLECEPKDKVRSRLKRSPDIGDAIIVAGERNWQIGSSSVVAGGIAVGSDRTLDRPTTLEEIRQLLNGNF